MINVTSVVSEFNKPDLEAYVKDYAFSDLQFKPYFPSDYTPLMTFESLSNNANAKITADVVAFDSRAPRKGRVLPGKFTGDIPKIEVARRKGESDLNIYRQLQDSYRRNAAGPAAAQITKKIIDSMYDDTTFCLDAVNSKIEYLAKQALSTGQFTLDAVNNEAGVRTQTAVKFGIPTANIANSTTNWYNADHTVATPISDIRTLVRTARAAGIQLKYMWMEQATLDMLVLNTEVQKFTASFAQNALSIRQEPNLNILNQSLTTSGLPTIVIWESYVNVESKAGAYTAVSGWQSGNVTFTTSLVPGKVSWTTSADAYATEADVSIRTQNDFTLIKVFGENDPIGVVTKGIAYAIPVIESVNQIYIRKTNQN